ncbi:hypothetical protein LPJ73_008002, partial [Coemansia sp. RSA 2703]
MTVKFTKSWIAPFEKFYQRTELRQSLRALQIEAIAFPYTPTADFDQALYDLCSDIQKYISDRKAPEVADNKSASSRKDSTLNNDKCAGTEVAEEKARMTKEVVQSTLTKDQTQNMMDDFIDRQRIEIDAINKEEFLIPASGRDTTCARTDAKSTNRGIQIQLDVIRDDRGALERSTTTCNGSSTDAATIDATSIPLGGLEERVENIRDHLCVQFVPESADIYRRVNALEDRLMMLEREFPPWSAEHFNQPGRRYAQAPTTTVYRILPAPQQPHDWKATGVSAARTASIPGTATSMTATSSRLHSSLMSTGAESAVSQHNRHRHHHSGKQPRKFSGNTSGGRASSLVKRQRVGTGSAAVGSPLDSSGKPIFHACGRGVNSSLTRSVIAQLQ